MAKFQEYWVETEDGDVVETYAISDREEATNHAREIKGYLKVAEYEFSDSFLEQGGDYTNDEEE